MNLDSRYLRPKKAELLKQRYALYEENRGGDGELTEISEAVIVIDSSPAPSGLPVNCGVVSETGDFIELSEDIDVKESIEQAFSESRPEYRDETVVYIGAFKPHWGHFITDCLSRFWFLERGVSADCYIFCCSNPENAIPANIREALELLGVWDKIRFIAKSTRFRKVIVPQRGVSSREYMLPASRTVYDRIRQTALVSESGKRIKENGGLSEKILLSRAKLPKALLNDIGTAEVENLFMEAGFSRIYPEKISLTELIVRLNAAKEVAAISGTVPHNILFGPSGITLIIIEKYAYINNYQQGIDIIKDLRVIPISFDWLIDTVDPGLGPFLIGLTGEGKQFFIDRGKRDMLPVSDWIGAKELRKYFRIKKRHYGRQWILPEWLEEEIGLLREAYHATMEEYQDLISLKNPLMLSDWLSPRLVAKMLLRRLRDK